MCNGNCWIGCNSIRGIDCVVAMYHNKAVLEFSIISLLQYCTIPMYKTSIFSSCKWANIIAIIHYWCSSPLVGAVVKTGLLLS